MKRPQKTYFLLCQMTLLVYALSACGGGNGNPAQVRTGSGDLAGISSERINGILVPPEPDESENNRTIAGVDRDKNGVRDDLDRWAATKFGLVQPVMHPIYMLMKSEQMQITSDARTKADAVAMFLDSINYGYCGARVIKENGFNYGEIADEIALRTRNTRARIERMKELDDLAGSFVIDTSSVHKDCKHPQ